MACAIILPTGLGTTSPWLAKRYRAIGKAMQVPGIDNMTDEGGRRRHHRRGEAALRRCGHPRQPEGHPEGGGLAFLAKSAFADACCPGNPRDTSEEEIAELYKSLL